MPELVCMMVRSCDMGQIRQVYSHATALLCETKVNKISVVVVYQYGVIFTCVCGWWCLPRVRWTVVYPVYSDTAVALFVVGSSTTTHLFVLFPTPCVWWVGA